MFQELFALTFFFLIRYDYVPQFVSYYIYSFLNWHIIRAAYSFRKLSVSKCLFYSTINFSLFSHKKSEPCICLIRKVSELRSVAFPLRFSAFFIRGKILLIRAAKSKHGKSLSKCRTQVWFWWRHFSPFIRISLRICFAILNDAPVIEW